MDRRQETERMDFKEPDTVPARYLGKFEIDPTIAEVIKNYTQEEKDSLLKELTKQHRFTAHILYCIASCSPTPIKTRLKTAFLHCSVVNDKPSYHVGPKRVSQNVADERLETTIPKNERTSYMLDAHPMIESYQVFSDRVEIVTKASTITERTVASALRRLPKVPKRCLAPHEQSE